MLRDLVDEAAAGTVAGRTGRKQGGIDQNPEAARGMMGPCPCGGDCGFFEDQAGPPFKRVCLATAFVLRVGK